MNPKAIDKTWRARTKRDLIIEVWEALDCESVGARELDQIQQVLRKELGAGAVEENQYPEQSHKYDRAED